MIVKTTLSSLWLEPYPKAEARLSAILDGAPKGTEIFFRADDIGAPGDNCREMVELFIKHGVPLHMAVTPAWLSESRWQTLRNWAEGGQFIWHQHGWRHVNHQKSGKKGEFGSDRTKQAKKDDLAKGKAKLESVMGNDFQPFFTPPWNRFDTEAGEALVELGFKAVSRSSGEMKKVPLPDVLPDIFINVDLHTRSESTAEAGWDALMDEFEQAATTGRIGVMLHHQRINDAAFKFLDILLSVSSSSPSIHTIRFDAL